VNKTNNGIISVHCIHSTMLIHYLIRIMESVMRIEAHAKINLGLDVTGRRPNGYHEVRMIMQSIDLHDELIIEEGGEAGICISTNDAELPVNEDNLIYKAVKLLSDEFGIREAVNIKLCKNIPVAAGLAGGSTDAAATLIGLNRLWNLNLSDEDLMKRAVKIGADVPYCIMGGTVIAEGIGEVLTPISNCPDFTLLIAKPPVSVSTKHVYQSLNLDQVIHPDIDVIIKAIETNNIQLLADNLGNVLESVTIKEVPVIEEIKQMMLDGGAVGSLMSGSGPTVFGIFDDDVKAEKCLDAISAKNIAKDLLITKPFHPRS